MSWLEWNMEESALESKQSLRHGGHQTAMTLVHVANTGALVEDQWGRSFTTITVAHRGMKVQSDACCSDRSEVSQWDLLLIVMNSTTITTWGRIRQFLLQDL